MTKKSTEVGHEAAPLAPERLTVPEIATGLRLTPEQLRVLDDIASGRPVGGRQPGVREVTQALALKASLSVAKPRSEPGDHADGTLVVLACPYCRSCACGRSDR